MFSEQGLKEIESLNSPGLTKSSLTLTKCPFIIVAKVTLLKELEVENLVSMKEELERKQISSSFNKATNPRR